TFDGATPTDGPQNSDGSYVAPTKDISFLYDGVSDHPVWVLNPLALLNALAGYVYLHDQSPTTDANLIYQGSAGDTDYFIIDADIVPILLPLESIGVPHFVLSALDEPLRVLIETAYRRDLGPGVPVHASLLPHVNPITVTRNLIKSIPVGIDDATEELGLGRPLGTTSAGPHRCGCPSPAGPAGSRIRDVGIGGGVDRGATACIQERFGTAGSQSQRRRSERRVGSAGYGTDRYREVRERARQARKR